MKQKFVWEGRTGRHWLLATSATIALLGCSGDGSSPDAEASGKRRASGAERTADGEAVMSQFNAVRLANQATFGATEAMITEMRSQGAKHWIVGQFSLDESHYRLGGDDAPDQNTSPTDFCALPAQSKNPNCWRDYFSAEPLVWDFYRNAVRKNDQLRQRVALALSQLLVISNVDVDGTYGLRLFYNHLMNNALGNYRDIVRKVSRSPMMGEYLNNVNNAASAPNENFARELLQLFTIGPCKLNADGTQVNGRCMPTYNNDMVRNYAYALTGWTYPPGGANRWGCWPTGANCHFLGAQMVPAAGDLRDTEARKLLSGVTVPAGSTAPEAMDKVLDSLMSHPNMAPYVSKHLISQLVTGNPSSAYVGRVAKAFNTGKYEDIGTGVKGDLQATVAAVLLDEEARSDAPTGAASGRLREPIQFFTGVIRAFNGDTDGAALGWWQGEALSQHAFRPPSVFNFYPAEYPVTGTKLIGPAFGIHNASTALERMNYLTMLFDWGGADAQKDIPSAVGTHLRYTGWLGDAGDAGKLVDRMSQLLIGENLPEPARGKVIEAVAHFDDKNRPDDWREQRVRRAGWLVSASPQYQIVR